MSWACLHCGVKADMARHWLAKFCLQCTRTDARGGNRARGEVYKAIKTGVLQSPVGFLCVDCGKTAREYDHRDYNKPLDVQPVCRSCNLKRGPAIAKRLPQAVQPAKVA